MKTNRILALAAIGLTAVALPEFSIAQDDAPPPPPPGRGPGGPGPGGPGGPGGQRRGAFFWNLPVLKVLDANGDQEISAEEIEGAAAALKTLDKNDDGKITEDELRPEFGGPGGPGGRPGAPGGPDAPQARRGGNPQQTLDRIFQSDANGDGKLTEEEVNERLKSLVTRADTDKDGAVTREELLKALESRPPREGQGPGRNRGGDGNSPRRPAADDQ